MATLYTNGDYIALTPAEFAAYSLIRYSAADLTGDVMLGLTASGTINFSARLGTVSAVIDGWTGNDNITAGSGNDSVWGNSGNDSIWGMVGNDLLIGDWDAKERTGNDALYGGDGNDELIGGTGNDILYGGNGDDIISFGDFESGIDQVFGGSGYDAISVRDVFSRGLDEVTFSRLVLNAAASVEFFALDDLFMTLRGTDGNDLIDLSGTTALTWAGNYEERISFDLGAGNDSYTGGASNDQVTLQAGGDRILLGDGEDSLILVGGDLTGMNFNGGAGQDSLRIVGAGGVPTEIVASVLSLTAASGFEVLTLDNARFRGTVGADRYDLSGLEHVFGAALQPFVLGGGNDTFLGSGSEEFVEGGVGNDSLVGGGGDDTLIGGAGADIMSGGEGGDTYQIDDLGDRITELGTAGIDTIRTSFATFSLGTSFESLEAQGNGGLFGTGNAANNVLTGAGGADRLLGLEGSDILNGGAGIDTLEGGTGNDIYQVTEGDVIREAAGDALDVVYVEASSYVLARNVEVMHARLGKALNGTGNSQSNAIFGSNQADTLRGMDGDDTILSGLGGDSLDGGLGRDILDGGEGNDSLTGGDGMDSMVGGSGNDMLSGGLGRDSLDGGDGDDVLAGGEEGDSLIGGAGNDELSGGIGQDTLVGGAGNDIYVVDDLEDRVIETYFAGTDTVIAAINGIHIQGNVENLWAGATLIDAVLYGNNGHNGLKGGSGNDKLYGGDGDDTLYSDAGQDTLYGGSGVDTYYIGADAGLVSIVESNAFTVAPDRIYTAAAVTVLTNLVDELYITRDTGAVARADSTLASKLFGGIGNDRLIDGTYMDGGLGADTMIGSAAGGTTFVVDDIDDDVRLQEGGAPDWVRLKLTSYVMGGLLENLVVINPEGARVTGSEIDNDIRGALGRDTLLGMAGDDTLSGDQGRDLLLGGDGNDELVAQGRGDTLDGGAGDDFYWGDIDETTVIRETRNGGVDHVQANDNYTLGDFFENLTQYGSGVTGTGNALDNVMICAYDVTVRGLSGDDTLISNIADGWLVGGTGDDVYQVGNVGWHVPFMEEYAGEGHDTVITAVSLELQDNIEDLVVAQGAGSVVAYGNSLANHIIGGAVGDYLIGRLGNDTLTGGEGADGFLFDDLQAADHITDMNAIDYIRFDRAVFTALRSDSSGQFLDPAQFKDLSRGAADSSDRILYDPTTGEVYYDVDGKGGAAALLVLILDNRQTLTHFNFFG